MEWTSFEKYLCSYTRTIVDGKSLDVKNISLDVILAGPHPVNLLCKLAPLSDPDDHLRLQQFVQQQPQVICLRIYSKESSVLPMISYCRGLLSSTK